MTYNTHKQTDLKCAHLKIERQLKDVNSLRVINRLIERVEKKCTNTGFNGLEIRYTRNKSRAKED